MDHDDPSVFARTVEWAVSRGVETATFHIMTPYPGTRLERRLAAEGRITSRDWDLYDTRHAVFTPAGMTAEQLEAGYWGAYRDFYRWSSIWRAAFAHGDLREHARHLAYTSGWKKLEPMWDWAIRSGQVHRFLPLLEAILDRFGSGGGAMPARLRAGCARRAPWHAAPRAAASALTAATAGALPRASGTGDPEACRMHVCDTLTHRGTPKGRARGWRRDLIHSRGNAGIRVRLNVRLIALVRTGDSSHE